MSESFSFESSNSSAILIGSIEDTIENDRLRATSEAFNDIARAQELREAICASYMMTQENRAFLYGPFVCMSSISPWKPIINIVRELKAQRLEESGYGKLPPIGDKL